MSCCNTYITLGCTDTCADYDTGAVAVQDGQHTLETYLVNGVRQAVDLGVLSVSDPIVIPANTLNENKSHVITVKQPDGSDFQWETDVFCAEITTYIVTV